MFERLGHTVLGTLLEAMPFFHRFGHTVFATLGDLAVTLYPVEGFSSRCPSWCLLAWGGENIRLLVVSELALRVWGMQNSEQGNGEVPRVICLNEMVPDGSSQPSHGLPPLPPPSPGIPRLPGGLNWAPRCSPEEWTAWCRVRDGLHVSNEYFETVQIERGLTWLGSLRRRGGTRRNSLYFVFEFGTKKGMQFLPGVLRDEEFSLAGGLRGG